MIAPPRSALPEQQHTPGSLHAGSPHRCDVLGGAILAHCSRRKSLRAKDLILLAIGRRGVEHAPKRVTRHGERMIPLEGLRKRMIGAPLHTWTALWPPRCSGVDGTGT